jgi:hypothetical protein
MSPGGGDVPGAQGRNARTAVQEVGDEMVAGSLCAGDGLGQEWAGVRGIDDGVAQQEIREAVAEQDIIAQPSRTLDGFPSGG